MKTNLDPHKHEPLLEAALRDEAWELASAAFKADALAAFRTHQRVRRVTRWTSCVAAVAAILAAALHWSGRPAAAPIPVPLAVAPAALPKPASSPRALTDRELIAAFPQGSCFIAEVDGKKELVFLDPEVKRAYLAGAPSPSD